VPEVKRLFVMLCLAALLLPAHSFAATNAGFKKGQIVSVNANQAALRSGPSTSFKTLWKLCLYWPVKILQKEGDWYKVADFEGDTGWLHRSLIANIATLVCTAKQADVRKLPESNAPLAWKAEKGYAIKVLSKKGTWYEVEDEEGDRGWIHNSSVWGNKQTQKKD
jgi:SH3-like domain-containing protein